LNLRYTLINENLKKMTKSPAGLVIREKFFRKKNMASNDSKLSNSARNAIKIFLAAAENGGDRRERRSNRRFLSYTFITNPP